MKNLVRLFLILNLVSPSSWAESSSGDQPSRFRANGTIKNARVSVEVPVRYEAPEGQTPAQAEAALQRCDPKLMGQFYDNLYHLMCQKSEMAGCPMKINLSNIMKNAGATTLGALYLLGSGVQAGRDELARFSGARSKLVFDYYSREAQRLFGPAAAENFRHLTHTDDIKELKKAIEVGRTQFATNPRYVKFLSVLEKNLMLPRAAWLRAMGKAKGSLVMGVGFAVLDFYFNPSNNGPTADKASCPGKQMNFVNRDQNCRFLVEQDGDIFINEENQKFLSLNADKQEKILKYNPDICQYWAALNSAIQKQIEMGGELKDVTCSSPQSVQYTVAHDKGPSQLFQLSYSPDGHVKDMKVTRLGGTVPASLDPSATFSLQFQPSDEGDVLEKASYINNFGVRRDLTYNEMSELSTVHRKHLGDHLSTKATEIFGAFREHKYYSNLAHTCCSIGDEKSRSSCLGEINNQRGILLSDLGQRVNDLATGAPQTAITNDKANVQK